MDQHQRIDSFMEIIDTKVRKNININKEGVDSSHRLDRKSQIRAKQ